MNTLKKLSAALCAAAAVTTTGITASASGDQGVMININKVDNFGRMISGPALRIDNAEPEIDLASVSVDGGAIVDDTDQGFSWKIAGKTENIVLPDGDYELSETVPQECNFTQIAPFGFTVKGDKVTLNDAYEYVKLEEKDGVYTMTITDQTPSVKFDITKTGEIDQNDVKVDITVPDPDGNDGTDVNIDLASIVIDPVVPSTEPLSGVKFEISDGTDNSWTLTTDEKGHAVSEALPKYMPDGTTEIKYEVKEIEGKNDSYVIEGGNLLENVDNVSELESKNGDVTYYVFAENRKKKKGTVEVLKLESETRDVVLEGAVFEITGSDGNKFTVTTGADGTAKHELYLEDKYGGAITYKAVETKAPSGYELDSATITLAFEENAEKEMVASFTAYNKKAAIVADDTVKPDDKNTDTSDKNNTDKNNSNKDTTGNKTVKKAGSVPNTADTGK